MWSWRPAMRRTVTTAATRSTTCPAAPPQTVSWTSRRPGAGPCQRIQLSSFQCLAVACHGLRTPLQLVPCHPHAHSSHRHFTHFYVRSVSQRSHSPPAGLHLCEHMQAACSLHVLLQSSCPSAKKSMAPGRLFVWGCVVNDMPTHRPRGGAAAAAAAEDDADSLREFLACGGGEDMDAADRGASADREDSGGSRRSEHGAGDDCGASMAPATPTDRRCSRPAQPMERRRGRQTQRRRRR